ncbi:hypothetical protein D3C74_400760 [compost metagenome]
MLPVTSSAASLTSGSAWPMATPRPAQRSMSMSLLPSPTATVAPGATPSRPRTRSSALALVTPSGAMSIHAVQPTAYVTSLSPSERASSLKASLVDPGLRTTTRVTSPDHSSSKSTTSCTPSSSPCGKRSFMRKPTPTSSTAKSASGSWSRSSRSAFSGLNVIISSTT